MVERIQRVTMKYNDSQSLFGALKHLAFAWQDGLA